MGGQLRGWLGVGGWERGAEVWGDAQPFRAHTEPWRGQLCPPLAWGRGLLSSLTPSRAGSGGGGAVVGHKTHSPSQGLCPFSPGFCTWWGQQPTDCQGALGDTWWLQLWRGVPAALRCGRPHQPPEQRGL